MDSSAHESAGDFIENWLKFYSDTYYRFFNMPAIGPAREKSEQFSRWLRLYLDLQTKWLSSISDLQGLSVEAMRKVHEKTKSGLEEELSAEKYKQLYNIWIETYSDTFKEYQNSDDFVSDMGEFVSNLMEFQKFNREIFENNYLKVLNLPTKADIDETNKELYTLRKKVRELDIMMSRLAEKK